MVGMTTYMVGMTTYMVGMTDVLELMGDQDDSPFTSN